MTIYKMTTISSNTRIRDQHNTAGNILASVGANVDVVGDDQFIALSPIGNPPYQAVGDKWIHVTYNGVTGWMAYTNLGTPICKDLVVVVDTDPIPPNPSDVKRIIDSVITWEDVSGVVHTTRMIPE